MVLVVIDLPDPKTGMRKLFPHHFFLVTNWSVAQRGGWELVEHYRRRGTFQDRLGDFNAVIGKGLSAGSFAANEASLLLKLLAFNLAGMLRGELEDASGCGWRSGRVRRRRGCSCWSHRSRRAKPRSSGSRRCGARQRRRYGKRLRARPPGSQ